MKTNRPTKDTHHGRAETWYDLGYEDSHIDLKREIESLTNELNHYKYFSEKDQKLMKSMFTQEQLDKAVEQGGTPAVSAYNRGWMEARDDMEEVMEIVHFCLKNDRALFAQLIIESYLKLENSNE
jgi:hypothetical protein